MGIISRILGKIRPVAARNYSEAQALEISSIPGFTPSHEAKRQILEGDVSVRLRTDELKFDHDDHLTCLPEDLTVVRLMIENCPDFRNLPRGLWANSVRIDDCGMFSDISPEMHVRALFVRNCPNLTELPTGLKMGNLSVENCPNLKSVPPRFHFGSLRLPNSRIERISGTPVVDNVLDLQGSRRLTAIPSMKVEELNLRGCVNFESLPDELEADVLCLSGCVRLRWQEYADVEVRFLDISDCVQITHLPAWLAVTSSIDVAGAGLTGLPPWSAGVDVRWRGVKVDQRIAFHPETIRYEEVLAETNVERRRVMLERIGWESFLAHVKHEVIDRDTDAGGERKLLSFKFDDEEDLRVLAVCCPSTSRRYFIRVPPHISRCHAAAAWIAGFDDPDDYRPIMET